MVHFIWYCKYKKKTYLVLTFWGHIFFILIIAPKSFQQKTFATSLLLLCSFLSLRKRIILFYDYSKRSRFIFLSLSLHQKTLLQLFNTYNHVYDTFQIVTSYATDINSIISILSHLHSTHICLEINLIFNCFTK